MRIRKQNKLLFYASGYFNQFFARGGYHQKIKNLKSRLTEAQIRSVEERVGYYCKSSVDAASAAHTVADLRHPKTPKSYYFDAFEYAHYFNDKQPLDFVFGDVTAVPERPSIVKSRPILDDNANSILLNLDKARHFTFVEGDRNFGSKRDMLIGRSAVFQQHRYDFYEKYFGNPLCDLGQINKTGGNPAWIKPKISIKKHLDYKFILSLEGNDVATNLKWIMSSNSIAVMPKLKYETWFMEGKLTGGVHFIEIRDDYSDLESQLEHYADNAEKCLKITENAHRHCGQFFNKDVEDLCALLVLDRYFL